MNKSPYQENLEPSQLPGVPWFALAIVTGLLFLAILFVISSLRSPELEWYPVSEVKIVEAGDRLVGPIVYTVDARKDGLTYFDFSRGSVIEGNSDSKEWDLAFNRFTILANGGSGFSGQGGIRDLGEVSFDSIDSVPEDGYEINEGMPELANPATVQWYDYSWTSHILKPKPRVFALRTGDGRYGKFEILSYYCPAAQPGCVTIRYVYQGSGITTF